VEHNNKEKEERQSIEVAVEFSGRRTRRFNTANTKAYHWTQSWASSIHFQPLKLPP
jgi:hypothetical protein